MGVCILGPYHLYRSVLNGSDLTYQYFWISGWNLVFTWGQKETHFPKCWFLLKISNNLTKSRNTAILIAILSEPNRTELNWNTLFIHMWIMPFPQRKRPHLTTVHRHYNMFHTIKLYWAFLEFLGPISCSAAPTLSNVLSVK